MDQKNFTSAELALLDFNYESVAQHVNESKANLVTAASVQDVKEQICSVWKKIGPFVKMAEVIPFVGKYIKLLASLLDSICA